ncbi:OmpA family protein [Pseudomonas matsuisoli]|uniref:Membrane protein n=1 Tax=Pseudomonas matsuisoli TaxID=1515666 RepID=A0A917US83_9PSED|nr:OmpA family protein [Pseudomonas matsuisoli]GGJ82098.1 membrane protein [Pseudomonas matsuisoli]
MKKTIFLPTLLAMAIGLSACATKPNPDLDTARSNFETLQTNPQATQIAALETKDANDALDKAEKAFRDGEDREKVSQLAYLANQRVNVAKQTIALRAAEQRLQGVSAERAQARLDARDAQIKKLQEQMNAKQTDRGTVVTFGDVLFDLNRSELKPGGMRNVQQLSQFLQENSERKVIIEGHTDSTGSDSYNQSLSERRAMSVKSALVRMGVDPSRLVTQGYGKEYPIADNSSAAGRAQNRRVEVTISNDANPVAPRQMGR